MSFKLDLLALFRARKRGGSFTDFTRLVNTEERAVEFFEIVGLINLRHSTCQCGNSMLMKIKRSNYKCNFRWACYSTSHLNVHYFNPLHGTVFADSRIPFVKIMDIMLNWFFRISFDQTVCNSKCFEGTVSRWFKRFRTVCQEANKLDYKIGGPGHWVELDETLLFKRKYRRGHRIVGEQVWIFGGVDRNTSKRFIVRVQNRKKQTLWPIIRKYVAPGSILVTDDFTSYRGIETQGYISHEVVVHRYNFRNPNFPDVYTNGVECLWAKLKKHVKRTGKKEQVDAAIDEFLYRNSLHMKFGRYFYGAKFRQFLKDCEIYM